MLNFFFFFKLHNSNLSNSIDIYIFFFLNFNLGPQRDPKFFYLINAKNTRQIGHSPEEPVTSNTDIQTTVRLRETDTCQSCQHFCAKQSSYSHRGSFSLILTVVHVKRGNQIQRVFLRVSSASRLPKKESDVDEVVPRRTTRGAEVKAEVSVGLARE